MTSPEKVTAALDRVEQLADDEYADQTVKAAAGMLTLGRGYLEKMIPTDPAELDELLARGSEWLRGLISDPPAAAA